MGKVWILSVRGPGVLGLGVLGLGFGASIFGFVGFTVASLTQERIRPRDRDSEEPRLYVFERLGGGRYEREPSGNLGEFLGTLGYIPP